MARKLLFYPFLAGLLISLVSLSFALEKVKLGTPTKVGTNSYLPALTAEQRGFWKENDLEVEWVPFEGAAPMLRAVAAGSLNVGLVGSEAISAVERGVPMIMVAEYTSRFPFYLWVRGNSPYRHPRDLKGAKIGVTTLGGTTHAFARVVAKAHGVEKDVRFVGAGGVAPSLAGFRAGAFEAVMQPLEIFVRLKLGGEAREVASTVDYLPTPWLYHIVFARKDLAQSKPDVVRKVIRATLQATDFIQKNPRWTMDLMKSFTGLSEEEARLVHEDIKFTVTGKIDRQSLENARSFYIEYGIITEKAPAVDDLFTNDYLPVK